MVVANLLRLTGHGEHDDAAYVPAALRESPLGRDCIEIAIADLVEKTVVSAEEVEEWLEAAGEEAQVAVAKAQQEPAPDPYRDDWRAYASPELPSG